MSRPWIFVTPSSRGIGHALTRHLLRTTSLPILATTRSDPSATNVFTCFPLDVIDEHTIQAAADKAKALFPVEANHLHLAFAIPGILHPEKSLRQVDVENALMTYRVNTLGPLLLMKHFSDFLPRKRTSFAQLDRHDQGIRLPDHAVWLNMSARVGSVSDNRKGGWYSYRSSKAGVNSLTKSFDLQLQPRSGEKAMAMAYHPGTVKTDLSKDFWGTVESGKLFDVEYAVEKMVEVATSKVGLDGRGRCWDWKAEEILP
ncbi:hypothetical protein N0V93_009164 [Gnomoniopsis smithogilvyi]|uniref:Short-chain dehydrogenase n=1 Tax=Gnomoniopsis smithogilvyi TaxID=1191159 RepID=A0A9W8YJZ6_9PEZI|nr:hypothetical protein N0V93_009164 [Gnomoniopsis smithogilvyi]